jgi:hypothetical protein
MPKRQRKQTFSPIKDDEMLQIIQEEEEEEEEAGNKSDGKTAASLAASPVATSTPIKEGEKNTPNSEKSSNSTILIMESQDFDAGDKLVMKPNEKTVPATTVTATVTVTDADDDDDDDDDLEDDLLLMSMDFIDPKKPSLHCNSPYSDISGK